MPSFDVVSEVDKHNLTNAVDQANRVVTGRYDFKGVEAKFELKEYTVTMTAEGDFQLKQMLDILQSAAMKNSIDIACLDSQPARPSGKLVIQEVVVKTGIETDLAKKIVKMIKEQKLKVQTQIQGDQLRVTGKKRDDLQSAIAFLRSSDIEQPLQYNNFRD
ncbi:YajQ family cyclic di-GMP-binding protein [Gilvimarinus agarilyticus]|uniref:YajQ family cyclic di-GMP-binding protein n=1 Tax=unclassified Gilvimarinus TaxID=2642066 RepID=UPI001C07EFED|nr:MULTISPECIES: YajQ family cyclic di-GMP-binding protein [unclassified Gilvimarinus]MBU2885424.1 YajQ family cyclic di-GMP-binding protein [Gilvimarinus agarilyticus]MDO6570324.1 YajQ family cyclic di-GMP-binding protein [Gilvimarinus sp. 2_MG-2023]MDO6746889.1 YajQ family cyclic di-GMP-binding protein [Gilvimarinus sp. 1_MG-2023]